MLVTMSQKELNRIPVLQQVCDKLLTQSAAAKLLNISVRQLQRVLARYLSYGAAGIASRKRGMPANNRAPDDLKLQVLALLREKYSDFGPTLATEKLSERHQISISVETVRHSMITDRLKELRLESISSIEEANTWLDSFILDFNRRFANPPIPKKSPSARQRAAGRTG